MSTKSKETETPIEEINRLYPLYTLESKTRLLAYARKLEQER